MQIVKLLFQKHPGLHKKMVSSTKSSCNDERCLTFKTIYFLCRQGILCWPTVTCQVSVEERILLVHEAEGKDSVCNKNCTYYLSPITSDSSSHSCYLKCGNIVCRECNTTQVLPCHQWAGEREQRVIFPGFQLLVDIIHYR